MQSRGRPGVQPREEGRKHTHTIESVATLVSRSDLIRAVLCEDTA